ncbi:hypothetical protein J6590_049409 [Homalodisca vitripennis]|nr:hypothetical protein J6590_049409 [Homalodisca vitripennis]
MVVRRYLMGARKTFKDILWEQGRRLVRGELRPIEEYGCEKISYGSKEDNSALRFVYNLKKFDHISPYRKRANLNPVQDICRLQTVTLVHKVLVTGEPSYLRRKLVARATLRERHTRQDDKLQLPRVRLEATKRSFSYFGPQEYNALPPVIKTLEEKEKLDLKQEDIRDPLEYVFEYSPPQRDPSRVLCEGNVSGFPRAEPPFRCRGGSLRRRKGVGSRLVISTMERGNLFVSAEPIN